MQVGVLQTNQIETDRSNVPFPGMDELDEFNEAPHIVHSDVLRVGCDDDYVDNDEDDEIETLVLSTDDLLNTNGNGPEPAPTIVSGGGSKPLILNGRSRNHL